jgi:glycosyltransferase involved in cell wall biosynthesis
VDWLHAKLHEHGHSVETVYMPHTDEFDQALSQMVNYRLMELSDYFDAVVTFRPPSHLIRHPRKIVWFVHHLRIFYDLWNSAYCPVPDTPSGRALRSCVMDADNMALREAYRIFANSRVVQKRLHDFNGIDSEVLYPPVLAPQIFKSEDYGNEIVSVCRMERIKRQHLLIEAIAHSNTPVRLRLSGVSLDPAYPNFLRKTAQELGVDDRVIIEERWITETEKAKRLAHALASAYVPVDEDSYGYPTIEAAHARRCTITAADSGAVSEFVIDDETGLVADPNSAAIARAFDSLYVNRGLARRLGEAANSHISDLGIEWDAVLTRLLS